MAGGVVGKLTTAGTGAGTHLLSNTFYGTCDTAAATAAKIVKLADTGVNAATLITGMQLSVKFTYANGVANPTLTIQTNGGTQLIAAKSIMRYGTTAPSTSAASSWRAGAVVNFVYDGTNWVEVSSIDDNSTYYYTSVYVSTASATAAKVGGCSNYALHVGHLQVLLMNANTYEGAITLNINSTGAKPIYINGAASSASNYSLPKAMYLVYYDGTNFYFRTDSYLTANITGTASNVRGTVAVANGGTGATDAATARTNLEITPANIGAATSSHTHSYLPLSGGTLTGAVTNTYANISYIASHGTANSSAGFTATRTDTGNSISLMVGSGGVNRGVYDSTNSAWILYTDGSNTVAQRGTLYTNAISASGNITLSGKLGVNGAGINANYAIHCSGAIYTNSNVDAGGHLTTTKGIYRINSYSVSSLSDLSTRMSTVYNSMNDGCVNVMIANPSVSFSPFSGGTLIITLYRVSSAYGSASAIVYASDGRGAVGYTCSYYNSSWNTWNKDAGQITWSTSGPSGGVDGDIWLRYV